MSDPFFGEIQIYAFDFAPRGWAMCNGQLLPINQNQALFSLLGTNFGGNGQTTFALPDLRGRVAVSSPSFSSVGLAAGEMSHTLTINELPAHGHPMQASSGAANASTPGGHVLATAEAAAYESPSTSVVMASTAVVNAGGGQAHENRQPFLVLNFCIALTGVFPSRS